MANFTEVFEDVEKQFTTFIGQIQSLNDINIKILANNDLKEIGKVVKATDLLRHMTNEDVIIILNERAFEQINEEQKLMVIEDLVAQIHFDLEKDKLSIIKRDFSAFSLLVLKYGVQKCLDLDALVKLILSDEEDGQASA